MTMTTTTKPSIRLTRRVREIEISPTIAVMNRAQELMASGVDVVDFGPGEPDFATPAPVAAAGIRAIEQGFTKYTNAMGLKALRDAIAGRYNRRYGTHLGPEHIIAGTGGKQELFNLILAMVENGDEVIIPSPYWVSFPDQVQFAGGRPVFAPTEAKHRFRPTLASIASVATERTRGVIINSPNNPTGGVIEETELGKIIEWCAARDAFLLFDETYELFTYGDYKHASAIRWFDEYPETVCVVNSMSKTFAMTGWRLGYAVAHPTLINAVGKIQSHSTTNPSSISQAAAIEALGSDPSAQRHRRLRLHRPRRCLLPLSRRACVLRQGRHPRLERLRDVPARRGTGRRRAGHGLRRRWLRPDQLRHVDGAPARGRDADRARSIEIALARHDRRR